MNIRRAFSITARPALVAGLFAFALSPLSALAQDDSVLTYHGDNGRSGQYVVPALSREKARSVQHLWHGEQLDEGSAGCVLSQFGLTFTDAGLAMENVQGHPVYLILATTSDQKLRMKPQNLLTGLPIKRLETVT
ncbi:hypothetical protein V1291_000153 [Nitrobacteraceae bacterium AZCC 1564]